MQKELSITPPSGILRLASRESIPGAVLSELVEQHPALDGVTFENGQVRLLVVITIIGHNAVDLNVSVAEEVPFFVSG